MWLRREFLMRLVALSLLPNAVFAKPERPQADVIGELRYHVAEPDDTLADLAIRYDLGYTELVAANRGIDPWQPPPDTRILLPLQHVLPRAKRRGIVINIADQRLYFFPASGQPRSYPIGVAAENTGIVLGQTAVVRKQTNPIWFPPPSIRAERPDLPSSVGPGPDNPLGSMALYLGWPAMVIHGTNRPYGIGRRVSHGCFRLYEFDIRELYPDVIPGLPVNVVYQPVKIGWAGHALMLEIHPDADQAADLEISGDFRPNDPVELPALLQETVGPALRKRIEWDLVAEAAWRRTGVPVRIDRLPVLSPSKSR